MINTSGSWLDPNGLLPDHMRSGRGVIVIAAGFVLGIDSNPQVQTWIGANSSVGGSNKLITTDTDPILGERPVGTTVLDCLDSVCLSVQDTTGHPGAKVLARFESFVETGPIGILTNTWEGGRSVFFTRRLRATFEPGPSLMLAALAELTKPEDIPATSTWSVLSMTLLLAVAATMVLRRGIRPRARHARFDERDVETEHGWAMVAPPDERGGNR